MGQDDQISYGLATRCVPCVVNCECLQHRPELLAFFTLFVGRWFLSCIDTYVLSGKASRGARLACGSTAPFSEHGMFLTPKGFQKVTKLRDVTSIN